MRKRKLFIVVIFFLFIGIIIFLLNLYKPMKEEIKTTFTTAEYLADFDELWEILSENYYYFPHLEKNGVDIEALKVDTRRQLENRIHDIEGFYYLLEVMFRKMHNFAHLDIVNATVYATYQNNYGLENIPDNNWKKVLLNPQTQAIYAYLEKTDKIKVMQKYDDYFIPEIEASYDETRDVIIFKIFSFDGRIYERDQHKIEEYLTAINENKIDHIIFDIRGNAGGNDKYWWNNIVGPFGGDYEWTNWYYVRETELIRDYFFNDFHPKRISNIQEHNVPTAVEDFGLTHYFTFTRKLSSDTVLEEKMLRAKRWVIIDEQVYSSADSFAAFCKETGWATLVGERTKGDGKGVSPILITLPKTGLLVRFSGVAVESSDGNINAITGTRPDVQINMLDGNVYDEIYKIMERELFLLERTDYLVSSTIIPTWDGVHIFPSAVFIEV